MSSPKAARTVCWVASAVCIITAGLHLTAYPMIHTMAGGNSVEEVRALLPLLWLLFGVDLAAIGVIVGCVAADRRGGGRLVLAAASACPFGAAVLQIVFLGFLPPTALLLACGSLCLAAAWLR